MRRHLPQKIVINRLILKLREAGLLGEMGTRYQTRKIQPPKCEEFKSVGFREVSYKDVFGAFLIVGGGYVLSVVIWILEKATRAKGGKN